MANRTGSALHELERQTVSLLQAAPEPDHESRRLVQQRVDDILRPAGALARLDELAVWLAGWLGPRPMVDRTAAVIFAADHGVADLSAYPGSVTAAMVSAFRAGRASISAMASVAGATVEVVDVGVGRPTADIRESAAMSESRFVQAFDAGRHAVARLLDPGPASVGSTPGQPPDVLIVGEMGIGNTAAAAAVVGALTGQPAQAVVGAGTGVEGERLAAKVVGVETALTRLANEGGAQGPSPFEVVRQVGGSELVAMMGAMAEARVRARPVLLDGYVVGASALALHRLGTSAGTGAAGEHLWAGHCSAEPGHRLVLSQLDLQPLLDLDFRLGEASGAMAAVPLLQMACRLVSDVPTFAEWFA